MSLKRKQPDDNGDVTPDAGAETTGEDWAGETSGPGAYRPMWREATGVSDPDIDERDIGERDDDLGDAESGTILASEPPRGATTNGQEAGAERGHPTVPGTVVGESEPQAETTGRPQPTFTPAATVPDPDAASGPRNGYAAEADLDTATAPQGEFAAGTAQDTALGSRGQFASAATATEPGTADSLPSGGSAGGLALDHDRPLLADAAQLRANWQQVQAAFVDNPREAVSDAADLVEHAAQALVGALRQRQRELREVWDGDALSDTGRSASGGAGTATSNGAGAGRDSTEDFRLLVQRYRALFNQICRP